MAEKIDDASYAEGRAAFAAGASIRSIVEQCMAADEAKNPDADVKAISGALGFADALLDLLRHPIIVSDPAPIRASRNRKAKR